MSARAGDVGLVTDVFSTDATEAMITTGLVTDVFHSDAAESWSTELTYVDDVLPASVRTRRRTTHGGATWLEAVAYSDGGGNVIQTKTRVAPGQAPALVEGEAVWSAADPRWVGSGRTVFDNKGQPIKQYEPFFAHSDAFEAEAELAEWGVTPVLRYDPAGRLVRVDLPDGSHRRVDFDAWSIVSFDECDTEAEGDHEDTPTTSLLDALGRPVRVRETPDGTAVYETRLVLDVTGNPTAVIDPRGNTVQTQTFDLLGRPLRTVSPEDGTTRVLFDVAGQPVRTWKTGGLHLQATFDEGRRPVSLLADGVRVHHTVYGDTLQTPPANSLGRPVQVWDTAGRLAFTYDFKGRSVAQTRQVTVDITAEVDWDTLDEELLDEESFTVETAYDALDRPTSQTAPDGAVTALTYEVSGRLFAVEVDSTAVVTGISYDARGQRLVADYGNHTSTAYTYDPARFWLTRLTTTRASSSTHGAATLQDLTYTRDLVGNLTSIADDAQETLYFANTQVSPTRAFVHDSLYRLVQATGREKDGLTQTTHELPSLGGLPDSGNPALRRYTQSYEYDEVGNLLEMKHQLGSGGTVLWRRGYAYAAGSNRPLSSSLPGDDPDDPNDHSALYSYDARGALANLPHLEGFTRDFRDQVRKVVLDLSGNEAWYAYDGSGQRVRKLVDKGAVTEERIYVGGWEVWRKRVNGTLDEERTTLHVMDGERRVATLETKTVADEEAVTTPVGRWRFQLDDHLGSAMGEADDEGGVFSYEELHPYGSVAWSAVDSALDVSARRYRYTGMERDEETGLQAHGVRLYAAWLGRWDRPDPIGLGDGVNRWGYCHGAPTRGKDASGMADDPSDPPVPTTNPFTTKALANPAPGTEHRVLGPHPANTFALSQSQVDSVKRGARLAAGQRHALTAEAASVPPGEHRENLKNAIGFLEFAMPVWEMADGEIVFDANKLLAMPIPVEGAPPLILKAGALKAASNDEQFVASTAAASARRNASGDPTELLDAWRSDPPPGARLIGFLHYHPEASSTAVPSAPDHDAFLSLARNANPERAWFLFTARELNPDRLFGFYAPAGSTIAEEMPPYNAASAWGAAPNTRGRRQAGVESLELPLEAGKPFVVQSVGVQAR